MEIWIPGSVDPASQANPHGRRVIDRCRVPVGQGELCSKPFFEGEDSTQHIVRCLRENAEHVRSERERIHPSVMKPWDVDYAGWVKRHRTALLEGRKKG